MNKLRRNVLDNSPVSYHFSGIRDTAYENFKAGANHKDSIQSAINQYTGSANKVKGAGTKVSRTKVV